MKIIEIKRKVTELLEKEGYEVVSSSSSWGRDGNKEYGLKFREK